MKKVFGVILGIVLGLTILWGILFVFDYNCASNMKIPMGYKKDNYYGDIIVCNRIGYRIEMKTNNNEITKMEMYMGKNYLTGSIAVAVNNKDKYKDYEKVSSLSSSRVDTKILVKYDDVLYGKSHSIIDYAGKSSPIGFIDKLIDSEYVPKVNGETNSEEVYNALVFDKTENSMVLLYNDEYILFEKI